ncbi:MAG: 3-phosphoshikimate 1-carboxyvinyltransferase [Bacteroidales bacterium]|jgi:3-phosphoshikimate 1-carboxyvinyltransferase|nr:3-phosphoshikimate 1-carboxyvinyltransferase [Bacteroidales bacterium]
MKISIKPSVLSGQINAKPSKSYEQRLLAGVLLSGGNCIISNCGNSDDVVAARTIIETLGCNIITEKNILKISSSDISGNNVINCNESALCARLFTPIACLLKSKFIVTGNNTLLNRPVADGFEIFKAMGSDLSYKDNKLPVEFSNAVIKSGKYTIDGSKTSQLISGLIMALSAVNGNSQLIIENPASIDYINLTINILKNFDINCHVEICQQNNLIVNIIGNQNYKPGSFETENDWSSASPILVAGALCGNISIKGLNKYSVQADKNILNVFDLANVNYSWKNDILTVKRSETKAFEFNAVNCPDLIPPIVVLALFTKGASKIHGAGRLLHKESSRGEVLLKELQKIGADISISDDIIEITGKKEYNTAILDSYNDHRIAMALSVAGLKINNGIEIKNPECIKKSYPEFYEDLKTLNANIALSCD